MTVRAQTSSRPAAALLLTAGAVLAWLCPAAEAAVVTASWETRADACTMVLQEEDRSIYRLRLIPRQGNLAHSCLPSAQAFTDAFNRVMQEAAPFRRQGKDTIRLFLGRLVELPEMSRDLSSTARQAREWNLTAGKPVRGPAATFVARLLLKSDTLRELLGGRRPVRIDVEKILVPSRDMVTRWKRGVSYPNRRVPYDCLLWVDLAEAP